MTGDPADCATAVCVACNGTGRKDTLEGGVTACHCTAGDRFRDAYTEAAKTNARPRW